MKVLLADKFEAAGIEKLKSLGCDVISEPDLSAETLAEGLVKHDPDVLIVRSTKVQKPALEAAKTLSLIIRAGAGYDTIDINTASARGIFVANCPGKNAIAVAELAFGFVLSCDRRIMDATRDIRAGKWKKGLYSKAQGLYGRTMGVIGRGQIAQALIDRAKGFGMEVMVWSRSLSETDAAAMGVRRAASLADLAKASDVVSVHVAATAETKNIIDAKFFDAMKKGAIFVNTSRGSVVDYDALKQAIQEKGIRAGLDVFPGEPAGSEADFTSEVANLDCVASAPHIGASTEQAQMAIAMETVRIIECMLKTGEIPNVVNLCGETSARTILEIRHENKPGVLAHVFNLLSQSSINVEQMENLIYTGEAAACARIHCSTGIDDSLAAKIRDKAEIISLVVKNP